MEEDRKKMDEMVCLEAEREAKEKADALKRLHDEEESIKAMERELELKKQALRDAHKAVDILADDQDQDEVASVSTVGDQVSPLWYIVFIPYSLHILTTLGGSEENQTASRRGHLQATGTSGPFNHR